MFDHWTLRCIRHVLAMNWVTHLTAPKPSAFKGNLILHHLHEVIRLVHPKLNPMNPWYKMCLESRPVAAFTVPSNANLFLRENLAIHHELT